MTKRFLQNITKGKATLLHFFASASLLLVVFSIAHWLWYPGAFIEAANALDIMLIIVLIDLSLGPTLMFIAYKPNKPNLKIDITIIVVVQLGFLAYGCNTIYEARPVFVALVDKEFIMVTANEIDPKDLAKGNDFNAFPQSGPVFVATKTLDNQQEIQEMLFAGLYGMGIQNLPKHYKPILSEQRKLISIAYHGESLKRLGKENAERLDTISRRAQATEQQVGFIPMRNKKKSLFVMIDMRTGRILGLR